MSLQPLPVDNWLKFLGTTVGRDKVYRTIQYFARFLAYYLAQKDYAKSIAQRLYALSAAVGSGRKLFRIGKPLDHLQLILKSLSIKNETIRMGTILKATGYGGWLLLDMLQWLHSQKVLDLSNYTKEINQYAPRLWLMGILASLATNMYKIQENFAQKQVELKLILRGSIGEKERSAFLDKELNKLAKDALQDLVDLVIPLSLMGVVDISPGLVGLAGTFTSLLGASSAWNF